jgi:hypothetical protein
VYPQSISGDVEEPKDFNIKLLRDLRSFVKYVNTCFDHSHDVQIVLSLQKLTKGYALEINTFELDPPEKS